MIFIFVVLFLAVLVVAGTNLVKAGDRGGPANDGRRPRRRAAADLSSPTQASLLAHDHARGIGAHQAATDHSHPHSDSPPRQDQDSSGGGSDFGGGSDSSPSTDSGSGSSSSSD